jgi:hypothetical protein
MRNNEWRFRSVALLGVALAACGDPALIEGDASRDAGRRDAGRDGTAAVTPDGESPTTDAMVQPADDGGTPPALDAGQTDPCSQRQDGTLCDGMLLRTCAAGRTVTSVPCMDGCIDRGAMSACASDAVDPCFNDPDGDYCGSTIGATTRQNDLYRCRGRRTERVDACPTGCFDRTGGTDVCASDMVDPCFNDPNGSYCGSTIGATTRQNDVYVCSGMRTSRIDACPMGCEGVMGMARCRTSTTDPCTNATLGDGLYCGRSLMLGAADTLYDCRARRTVSATPCSNGCAVRPPGMPDACNPPPSTSPGYRLPYACGTTQSVSQGNNSAFSHNGTQAWAYDFSMPRGTAVHAMESGTVSHVNGSVMPGGMCWNGGGSECANVVNYVSILHGDGTRTLYLHLDAPTVARGATVTRGQQIGRSGNTGWSTGAHLHVQRQANCSSWFCTSQSLTFQEAGMPATGARPTSNNCP